jgi:hypothetical protein
MVDLPAPEGDDSTSISPRRAILVTVLDVEGLDGVGLMVHSRF